MVSVPFCTKFRAVATLLVAISLVGGMFGHQPPAYGQTNEWSPESRLTSGGVDSMGPSIAIDSNGVSHIAYVETDFGEKGDVYYVHNRDGAWSSPQRISDKTRSEPGGGNRAVSVATVTINGVVRVGVAFQARRGDGSRRILYRESNDGGVNWGPIETATGHTSIHPELIYDNTGTPHLAYIKAGGDQLSARYATKENMQWTSVGIGTAIDRNPSITYTRDPAGHLWLHVYYQTAPGFNSGQNEMRIVSQRRSPGGSWTGAEERDRVIAQFPSVTSDRVSMVYAAWSSKKSGYDIEPMFSVSNNNGEHWSSPMPVGTLSSDLGQRPSITRSPVTGALAVVWEDDYNSESQFRYDIYGRMSFDGGQNWSELQTIFRAHGGSGSAKVSANPTGGFRTVWDDGNSGRLRIFTSGYNDPGPSGNIPVPPPTIPVIEPEPTPEVQKPVGTIAIKGLETNPEVTNTTDVSVDISLYGGTADQYQLSSDTNFLPNGFLPFTGTLQSVPWKLPAVQNPEQNPACVLQTVYGTLRNSTNPDVTSGVLKDTIWYDPGVDADVRIGNPSVGDPGFTSSPFYLAEVVARAGECSGLKSISFGKIGMATTQEYELSHGVSSVMVPLADAEPQDGAHQITVTVTDFAGNVREYQNTIMLDTQPPRVSSATGSFVAGEDDEGGFTSFSDLSFGGLMVIDSYRSAEDSPIWGVALANSRVDIPETNRTQLNQLTWTVVPVQKVTQFDGRYGFSVEDWSIKKGITSLTPGTYYIYARIVDGAGNMSDEVLKATYIVQGELTQPTIYLPIVKR